ncbi:hypothetical protein, partial [Streptomyces scabiei]|uniref:hypothetical protein n=1 Tax=Streptomyces scabiei TaxID=1930 RepID=UPI0038F7AB70
HAAALERLVLDGLDEDETTELLRGYASHPSELTAPLVRALRDHTGGSPLLLRSLLHEHSVAQLGRLAARDELPATGELVSTMGE